eukprot:7245864-Pyramimonas_sp.AAC.1
MLLPRELRFTISAMRFPWSSRFAFSSSRLAMSSPGTSSEAPLWLIFHQRTAGVFLRLLALKLAVAP